VLAVAPWRNAAVDAHRRALRRFLAAELGPASANRSLRQSLGHSLAALATARPEATFALLDDLAGVRQADAVWLVEETLRRPELQQRFPGRLDDLERALAAARR